MSGPTSILVIVVVTALAFDFTNGFHDTANVVATSISTRAHVAARRGRARVGVLNFAGAFISLKVAATSARGIVDPTPITTTVVFAGLVGAIAWNLATWYFGLPSSSLPRAHRRARRRGLSPPAARARSRATGWSRR